MQCTQALYDSYEDEDDVAREDPKVEATLEVSGTSFNVMTGENIIGRDPDFSNILLDFEAISATHAKIDAGPDGHMLCDLGSRNKTKLKGKFLKPNVQYFIEDGDTIFFADIKTVYHVSPPPEDAEETNKVNSQGDEELVPDTPARPLKKLFGDDALVIPESPDILEATAIDDSFVPSRSSVADTSKDISTTSEISFIASSQPPVNATSKSSTYAGEDDSLIRSSLGNANESQASLNLHLSASLTEEENLSRNLDGTLKAEDANDAGAISNHLQTESENDTEARLITKPDSPTTTTEGEVSSVSKPSDQQVETNEAAAALLAFADNPESRDSTPDLDESEIYGAETQMIVCPETVKAPTGPSKEENLEPEQKGSVCEAETQVIGDFKIPESPITRKLAIGNRNDTPEPKLSESIYEADTQLMFSPGNLATPGSKEKPVEEDRNDTPEPAQNESLYEADTQLIFSPGDLTTPDEKRNKDRRGENGRDAPEAEDLGVGNLYEAETQVLLSPEPFKIPGKCSKKRILKDDSPEVEIDESIYEAETQVLGGPEFKIPESRGRKKSVEVNQNDSPEPELDESIYEAETQALESFPTAGSPLRQNQDRIKENGKVEKDDGAGTNGPQSNRRVSSRKIPQESIYAAETHVLSMAEISGKNGELDEDDNDRDESMHEAETQLLPGVLDGTVEETEGEPESIYQAETQVLTMSDTLSKKRGKKPMESDEEDDDIFACATQKISPEKEESAARETDVPSSSRKSRRGDDVESALTGSRSAGMKQSTSGVEPPSPKAVVSDVADGILNRDSSSDEDGFSKPQKVQVSKRKKPTKLMDDDPDKESTTEKVGNRRKLRSETEKNKKPESSDSDATDDENIFNCPTQMISNSRSESGMKKHVLSDDDATDDESIFVSAEQEIGNTDKKVAGEKETPELSDDATDDGNIFNCPTQRIESARPKKEDRKKAALSDDETDDESRPPEKIGRVLPGKEEKKKSELSDDDATDDENIFNCPTQKVESARSKRAQRKKPALSDDDATDDEIESNRPIEKIGSARPEKEEKKSPALSGDNATLDENIFDCPTQKIDIGENLGSKVKKRPDFSDDDLTDEENIFICPTQKIDAGNRSSATEKKASELSRRSSPSLPKVIDDNSNDSESLLTNYRSDDEPEQSPSAAAHVGPDLDSSSGRASLEESARPVEDLREDGSPIDDDHVVAVDPASAEKRQEELDTPIKDQEEEIVKTRSPRKSLSLDRSSDLRPKQAGEEDTVRSPKKSLSLTPVSRGKLEIAVSCSKEAATERKQDGAESSKPKRGISERTECAEEDSKPSEIEEEDVVKPSKDDSLKNCLVPDVSETKRPKRGEAGKIARQSESEDEAQKIDDQKQNEIPKQPEVPAGDNEGNKLLPSASGTATPKRGRLGRGATQLGSMEGVAQKSREDVNTENKVPLRLSETQRPKRAGRSKKASLPERKVEEAEPNREEDSEEEEEYPSEFQPKPKRAGRGEKLSQSEPSQEKSRQSRKDVSEERDLPPPSSETQKMKRGKNASQLESYQDDDKKRNHESVSPDNKEKKLSGAATPKRGRLAKNASQSKTAEEPPRQSQPEDDDEEIPSITFETKRAIRGRRGKSVSESESKEDSQQIDDEKPKKVPSQPPEDDGEEETLSSRPRETPKRGRLSRNASQSEKESQVSDDKKRSNDSRRSLSPQNEEEESRDTPVTKRAKRGKFVSSASRLQSTEESDKTTGSTANDSGRAFLPENDSGKEPEPMKQRRGRPRKSVVLQATAQVVVQEDENNHSAAPEKEEKKSLAGTSGTQNRGRRSKAAPKDESQDSREETMNSKRSSPDQGDIRSKRQRITGTESPSKDESESAKEAMPRQRSKKRLYSPRVPDVLDDDASEVERPNVKRQGTRSSQTDTYQDDNEDIKEKPTAERHGAGSSEEDTDRDDVASIEEKPTSKRKSARSSQADTDGDDVSSIEEKPTSKRKSARSSQADTDGDDVSSIEEKPTAKRIGTRSSQADTDRDDVASIEERPTSKRKSARSSQADTDGDDVASIEEKPTAKRRGTRSSQADTDRDDVASIEERPTSKRKSARFSQADTDGDDVSSIEEKPTAKRRGTRSSQADTDGDDVASIEEKPTAKRRGTRSSQADTDRDDVASIEEKPTSKRKSARFSQADTDGDDVSSIEEKPTAKRIGTRSSQADTDRDDVSSIEEKPTAKRRGTRSSQADTDGDDVASIEEKPTARRQGARSSQADTDRDDVASIDEKPTAKRKGARSKADTDGDDVASIEEKPTAKRKSRKSSQEDTLPPVLSPVRSAKTMRTADDHSPTRRSGRVKKPTWKIRDDDDEESLKKTLILSYSQNTDDGFPEAPTLSPKKEEVSKTRGRRRESRRDKEPIVEAAEPGPSSVVFKQPVSPHSKRTRNASPTTPPKRARKASSVVSSPVKEVEAKPTKGRKNAAKESVSKKDDVVSDDDSLCSESSVASSTAERRGRRRLDSNDSRSSFSVARTPSTQATPQSPSASRRSVLRQSSIKPTPTYSVLFTGFADEKLEKLVVQLGGRLVDSVESASVAVSDKLRRTVKFLSMMAKGQPIVGPNWITQSNKAGQFQDPWKFLLMDKESEKKFQFSMADSLRMAALSKLLDGYSVFVTKNVSPPPDAIKDIIISSGGVMLPKMPTNWPQKSVIISCVEDVAPLKKKKNLPPIVVAEWLLSGVLQQCLDTVKFKLS